MTNPLGSIGGHAPTPIKTHVGTLALGVLLGGGLVWLVDTAARDNANDLKKTVSEQMGQIKALKSDRDNLTEAATHLVPKSDLERAQRELSDLKASMAELSTPVSTRQTVDNKWCPWGENQL